MIVVVFEVVPKEGKAPDYFGLAGALRSELEAIDGFISVERFESLTTKGKFLSLSTWRDEAAVKAWHAHAAHRAAQHEGKTRLFADYRIRVAEVLRDYTLTGKPTL
ncbi:MAG: antibiotic biosynthesis monooxygenase [Alphaproteobacteria bacterium]|nr:antibiotic biosynthesis monooxygenase [Alphaproteobacteria bacterium]